MVAEPTGRDLPLGRSRVHVEELSHDQVVRSGRVQLHALLHVQVRADARDLFPVDDQALGHHHGLLHVRDQEVVRVREYDRLLLYAHDHGFDQGYGPVRSVVREPAQDHGGDQGQSPLVAFGGVP